MSNRITSFHPLCDDYLCKYHGKCALALKYGTEVEKFPRLDLRNKRKDYNSVYYEDMQPATNEYNVYCRDYQKQMKEGAMP